MALVRIAEVQPAPQSRELAGFALDTPQAGREADSYALDVRGWVLGAHHRAEAVELRSGDTTVRTAPVDLERPDVESSHPDLAGADRCGFFTTLSALALEQRFELELEARLAKGAALPLARVTGERAPLASPFHPLLRPVVLTTLGRTGSTAVVRMLAAHPRVVAYRPFEYEPRVASYWMAVFGALADPAGYRRQLAPTGTLDAHWWLGHRSPLPRRIHDAALEPLLDVAAIGELAAFAQQRVERLYAEVAAAEGRAGATHFVEKYRPDAVPRLMLELYPEAREVMLVRDFRDMVASMFAYNEKRGRQGFGRDRADSDREYVLSSVRTSVEGMADAWRRRSASAHLLRYEDLVLRPAETVERLLEHLGLEGGREAVEPMVAGLLDGGPGAEGHRTAADARASIGRWRRDLSADVAAACEEALAAPLETFGYPRE